MFALTVEDINDNAPHFTKGKYKGRVAEDATIFISFDENIQVEDIDQVDIYIVRWPLSRSNYSSVHLMFANYFTICFLLY